MEWDDDDTVMRFAAPSVPRSESLLSITRDLFVGRNEVRGAGFDEFRQVLNHHFYPARVEPLSKVGMTSPTLSAIHLKHLTLAYVRFGVEAMVDPGDITGYHVNVPLRGTVLSICGDQRALTTPMQAAVFSPHQHTVLPRWDFDATQLCIKVNRASLDAELSAMLDEPVTAPVQFALGLNLADGPGRAWMTTLQALLQHCAPDFDGGPRDSMVELLERALITSLLSSQQHSYSNALVSDGPRISSRQVRQTMQKIERAPELPHTVTDLAVSVGVSTRMLQAAFQKALGMGPMQYVRQVRLDRAREDLRLGRGPISAVAYHWGFSNLGRFAAMYRQRFGELPSETATHT